MAKTKTRSEAAGELRRQAEDSAQAEITKATESMEALTPAAARQALHELRVHQIELEMQNEELRRTQEELEFSRTRYFNLYNLAPTGYFTISEQGIILEANLTAATLLGVARSVLVKQPISRFIFPEDQDKFYLCRKHLFEAGAPQVCELRMLHGSAAPIWVRLEAILARDDDGAPACRASLSDITEHKQEQQEIQSLAKFPAENPNPILRIGREGTLLYINQAGLSQLKDWSLAPGRPVPAALQRILAETINKGATQAYNLEYGRQTYSFFVSPAAEGLYANLYGRDITESKQIEDTQMFLLQCGYAGEDFFKSLAQYLAKSLEMDYVCIDRLHGDGLSAQTVAVFHDGLFEDNVSYTLKDTPCGDAVGKTVCCFPRDVRHLFPKDVVLQEMLAESYVGTTLWSHDGRAIGLIAVIGRKPLANPSMAESLLKLVSIRAAGELERRQAEDALRCFMGTLESRIAERTQDLESANASLEESAAKLRNLAVELMQAEERERKRLAGILHDHLQQFLVAAKFKVDALKRKAPDDRQAQPLQEVLDVLSEAISASRSLTADLCPPVLRDGGLMPGLLWLGRRMKETHNLTVEVTGTDIPGIPDPLALLLFQAARELLLNVVKHAGVDRVSVEVSQPDADSLRIAVNDEGVGFADNASENFGLFQLRERLSYIGGALEVASAPGQGSRVSVTVPFALSPKSSAITPIHENALKQVPPDKPKPEIRHLLVVDDHAVLRQGLIELLGKETDIVVVGVASNGQEAVQAARELQPDIILMDISMPVMNGIDAARIITAELPETQVIGLSMHEHGEMSSRMQEAGATAYLQKDEPIENLIAAIRALPPRGRTAPAPVSR